MDKLASCCEKIKPNAEPIFISSRIRLARNLAGENFPEASSEENRARVYAMCGGAILKMRKFAAGAHYNLNEAGENIGEILAEKNLISRELTRAEGARGAFISADASACIMVNEEDHLRIQAMERGLCLQSLWKKINSIDDYLEKSLPYAFSGRFGYLTACPSNTGTGMRASVMMHLFALDLNGDAERVIRGLNQLGIVARGTHGEGSDPAGAFYQISNQQTLGFAEQEIIERITNTCMTLAAFEQNARQKMLEDSPEILFDKFARAWAVLESAYVLSSKEAIECLSALRAAADMGFMGAKSKIKIDETFVKILPAHLCGGMPASPEERDVKRAKAVKLALKSLKKPVFPKSKKRAKNG